MQTEVVVIDIKDSEERIKLYDYLNKEGYGFTESLKPLVIDKNQDQEFHMIKLNHFPKEPKRIFRTENRLTKYIPIDVNTFFDGCDMDNKLEQARKIIYGD